MAMTAILVRYSKVKGDNHSRKDILQEELTANLPFNIRNIITICKNFCASFHLKSFMYYTTEPANSQMPFCTLEGMQSIGSGRAL